MLHFLGHRPRAGRRRTAVAVCCVSSPQAPAPITATLPFHGLRPMGGRGGGARLMGLRHVAFPRSSSSCRSSPHRRRFAPACWSRSSPCRRRAGAPRLRPSPCSRSRLCVACVCMLWRMRTSFRGQSRTTQPLDRPGPPGPPGGAPRSRPRFPVPLDWPGFPGSPGAHPGRLDTVPGGRRGGLSGRREPTRADRLQCTPG
jgi:hypothetical protein